jgi:hypothetical protein
MLAIELLQDRKIIPIYLLNQKFKFREFVQLVIFIILSSGIYGVVLSGFRSLELSLYVAVKLPTLFLGTIAIVSIFNWITATILGVELTFRSTLFVVLASMSIGCWILLSLAPVAIFFIVSSVSYLGTNQEQQIAHNITLLLHITVLGLAGVAGNISLFQSLKSAINSRISISSVCFLWISAFALVGCQLSWILRPFIGSPFYPIVFMRPDALKRNFYEFIFKEIIPYVIDNA